MVVNPERGAVRVKSEDGKRVYVLRLEFAALSLLQDELNDKRDGPYITLPQLLEKLQALFIGQVDDLGFFLRVILAALQEFQSDQFKTIFDVDRFIKDVGGMDALNAQLRGLQESLTPDPEDQKRRAANPRKARPKKT